MAMASLAETRDNETGNHIRRTQHYVRALATKLSTPCPASPRSSTKQTIESLYKSAPLHDIGKVGIPDAILLKPGKLTPEEFEIMKTHTTLGRDAILAAEKLIDAPSTFLRHAREIAMSHQEKWDGSGYPEGLAGDAIPISARLMAVADVYDALISQARVQAAVPAREGGRHDPRGARQAFRPRHHRRVPADRGRIPRHRRALRRPDDAEVDGQGAGHDAASQCDAVCA